MSQFVDNLIAFRILTMLVTPFEKTKAYKLGIIDKNGEPLKKLKDMSFTEKDQYSMLHRMVFRIKRIMSKVPIVGSQLGTLAAAYFLVRECLENNRSAVNLEEDYQNLLTKIKKDGIILGEEFLLVSEFLNEDVPTNATGVAVKTDEPVIRNKKNFVRMSVPSSTFAKFTAGKKKVSKISEYHTRSEDEQRIYECAAMYPNAVLILTNDVTGETKALKFGRNAKSWE